MIHEGARDLPADLLHHPEQRLWVRMDPDSGRARIGLDAVGLAALGDVVFVALDPSETELRPGSPFGTLEAAKMTSTLLAPIGGRVVACNDAVVADPSLLGNAPYTDGWLLELEPATWAQDSSALLGGSDAEAWARAEWARLDEEETG
ncbi:MAG: glycine cleavage system protein H [Planctomycetes bacterium]|nr:glycine cleavage system protein H [Planctomycetota bacterium]MCB9871081.1 glycine cleavage system protein H [Planctomycetota bacterium]MCB9888281.1 glycine cleavage system protein H [Planctomycetota bacterium]